MLHVIKRLLGLHPSMEEKPGDGKRSPHWPAVRRAHLAKHPLCEGCGGKDHPEVHHKKPFHLHPELELEPSNFLTLCEHPGKDCHYRLGHNAESWSEFNPKVVADAAAELTRLTKRRRECARSA